MIIFVADNAGPARHLIPLIRMFPGKVFVCASAIAGKIFREEGVPCTIVPKTSPQEYAHRIVQKVRPRLVITGTSWGISLEKYFLREARQSGIKSVSVIENWSFYKEGFLLRGKTYLPDRIFVNDSLARKGAIADGLPEDSIYSLGNAYFEERAGAKIAVDTLPLWVKKVRARKSRIIVFISERYKDDFPIKSPSYQGFDEFEVIEDLRNSITPHDHMIIRPHPADKTGKYRPCLRGTISCSPRAAHLNDVIAHADFIIGMGSMALIEASLFRRDIISYRPRQKLPFVGNILGVTRLISDVRELREVLEGKIQIVNKKLGNHFSGSKERIRYCIEEMLS